MTEVHDLTFGEPSDEGVGTEASRGWGRGSPMSSSPPPPLPTALRLLSSA